jgi:uncharacterized UPF0160 family protein
MTITHLVTHSGGFHADELLSSVVLTRLFPQAELLRSRDRQWVTPAANKIIYDVGGAYDGDAQNSATTRASLLLQAHVRGF